MANRIRKLTVNGVTTFIDLLTQPVKNGYSQIIMRGGGYVPGIDIESGVAYIRTDVGGAYRYDANTSKWSQLITSSSLTSDQMWSDYHVESLAAAPSNSSVVYALVGESNGSVNGRLIRSSDSGQTWTTNARTWYVSGNEGGKESGRRISIDPSNPQVLYIGTRKNGLQKSTDGGVTFSQVSTIPTVSGDASGTGAIGYPCILIDPSSTVLNGQKQVIWASVFGVGLCKSSDAGNSWNTVAAFTTGFIKDIVQGSSGTLYAVFNNPSSNSGCSIRKISSDGTIVTDITPGTANGWSTIAINPSNEDIVFVASYGLNNTPRFFRSTNATSATPTWTNVTWSIANGAKGSTWFKQSTSISTYMSVGQMRFFKNDLWFSEGTGIWTTGGSYLGSAIVWTANSDGINEFVANTMLKPSGSPLLTASWDFGVMRHKDPVQTYPLNGRAAYFPYYKDFGAAWDIAVSPTDPSFIVAQYDDSQDVSGQTSPSRRASGYSSDGGQTWTRFPYLTGTPASDLLFGNLAVSASNNSNIVWVPSNLSGTSSKVYYSLDKGTTFTLGTLNGLNSQDSLHLNKNQARHVLISHPTTSGTFMILGTNNGQGIIWQSTDSGATWSKLATTGLGAGFNGDCTLAYASGYYFAIPANGSSTFYKSSNLTSWTPKTNISGAWGLGIGRAMVNGGSKALYTYGTVGSVYGLYRSTDLGENWVYLDGNPLNIYTGIRTLAGDPDISGRVYIALGGGMGFALGQYS